jgi:hypothetical protein
MTPLERMARAMQELRIKERNERDAALASIRGQME